MKRSASKSPDFPPPQPPSLSGKKTRELPNLSDCHCCNRHINNTNPRNRLRLLTSEWRIVLLCKSCYNLVETSQFCAYCLSRVSDSFYECQKCHHRIHRDCALKFSFGSSDCGNDFSVCFDCWLPNLLENEYNLNRALRSASCKKKGGKNGVELAMFANSGVCDSQEKGKGLEGVVNDANAALQKKVVGAIEAKEKASTKIMAAKKAVEAAGGALEIVAVDKDGDERGMVVDEDAQLAFRLHREMNSSPRISRNWCLLNTNCVDTPMVIAVGNGLESRGGHGTNGSMQECKNKVGRLQDKKCNGGSRDCWITYIRKGQASAGLKHKEAPYGPSWLSPAVEHKEAPDCSLRASTDVEGKEEPDCSLKVTTSMLCKEQLDYPPTASTVEKQKERLNCSLKVYNRKPAQVKREVVAGNCSKTYSRRPVQGKKKLVNGSLNLENGNHDGSRSLTDAS